jgi:hypothetical protein
MVYGLIPKLRRENNLSEVFIQSYESDGERPNASSPEAVELCQQFFTVAKDAKELNKHSGWTALSKNYSDAIQKIHPVLILAFRIVVKIDQTIAVVDLDVKHA